MDNDREKRPSKAGDGDMSLLEDYVKMEQWLDDHQDFVHDYFSRKATKSMVDGWLIAHAVRQSNNNGDGILGGMESGSTGSNSRASSGANTPVRKISAQEFECSGQALKPMVSTVDGNLTFLGPVTSTTDMMPQKSRRTHSELKALDERELMYQLVMDICCDLEVTSLCHKILQNLSLLLNADRCSLFLIQGEKDTDKRCLVNTLFDVTTHSSLQYNVEKSREVRVPWGAGIVGHVAKTGQTLNTPNAYEVSPGPSYSHTGITLMFVILLILMRKS